MKSRELLRLVTAQVCVHSAMTGARLAGHILLEGQRRKAKDPSVKWGVVTMCIGGGQGAAGLFEIF